MSYLLEALKKSDSQRNRDEIPDLQADHYPPSSHGRERRPSGLPLFVILLIISFVCVTGSAWMYFSTRQPVEVSEKTESASSVVKVLPEKSAVLTPQLKEHIRKEVSELVAQSQTPPERLHLQKSVPVQKEIQPIPVLLPLLEELPVGIRASIPELQFAGHAYSEDSSKRLIIINNRIMREGGQVVQGLLLEEITRNGVVLSYENTFFLMDLSR